MNASEFLGLRATHNPHRWVLPIEPSICVQAGFLFGGCGIAAAVSALEATCKRPLVWATAQYLSYARPPEILDLDVTIPVAGTHTTQARAIGHVGDREIFTVNAALGNRPLDVHRQWATPPKAPPPTDCPVVPPRGKAAGTLHDRVDLRVAGGRYAEPRDGTPSGDGRSMLWVRVRDGVEMSAALLAIIADWMTSGIGPALGRWAGGNSLDNTIRIVHLAPTEWVLCDIRIHAVRNGFGHGLIHLWTDGGHLLATGGQSVIVRIHD